MPTKSLFYQFPRLYLFGLKWIHKKNFDARYQYMASLVQDGDSVLEPACGPAVLADYLPSKSSYRGFDLNEKFIHYASKKHSNVSLGDVLDGQNYQSSDVVITCDILHHLPFEVRKTFVQHCFNSAQKMLIMCEPGQPKPTKNFWYPINKALAEWSERDGTNNVKIDYFFTHQELMHHITTGFEVIPEHVQRDTKEFGEDIIAVFYKDTTAPNLIASQASIVIAETYPAQPVQNL